MIDARLDIIFWLGIMRDHAMFELNTLAPSEKAYIQQAMYFRDYFQKLINEVQGTGNLNAYLPAIRQGLLCLMEFKKAVLKGLLECKIQINLPPSLINHQLNEAMEFLNLLNMPSQMCLNNMMNLAGYVKTWLADSIGHASAIASFLDPSEELLVDEAQKYKLAFNKLFTKASEMEMMMDKTCTREKQLILLAEETVEWMNKFICYLEKIRELRGCCKALAIGTLQPLIPDHFIREHSYFITKLKACMACAYTHP